MPTVTFRDVMSSHAGDYLYESLVRSGGNVTAAARLAGLSRSGFYRLCTRHGISTGRPIQSHTVLHSRSQRRAPRMAHA